MGGLIPALAGAPQAASNAQGYYQNAADMIATQTGSPEAQMFSKEQMAALRPMFAQQDAALTAQNAAQGIGASGAGRYNFGNLGAQQAGVMAGSVAPLYSQAESQYGNIIGAMPGAQEGAYQGAVDQLLQAIQTGATAAGGMGGFDFAGVPGMPGASGSTEDTSPGQWNTDSGTPMVGPSTTSYYGGGGGGFDYGR
jgi:hypothetical protein